MAGTENNAAITAALQAEEFRKLNPFVKGQKGFNTQNDRVKLLEARLNNPVFSKIYPLIKPFIKSPYEAGKFCKKFGYYEDCKELKHSLKNGRPWWDKKKNYTNDKRTIYDVQTDAWKADYERGFTGTEETTVRNGKNFKSKYGRTRSKRSSRRVTRKRV